MTARAPIVLLIIAALLLGYVLAFERGRPGRSETDSRSGLLLERLVKDRVTRIRIASGETRVSMLREGEGFDRTWTLEAPRTHPADSEQVEDYLRNWEFAIPVRTLESPSDEDLKQFGLDAPKGEVTLEMGRAEVVVTLGAGSPVDGGGYVRIDGGEAVTVVGDDVVALFSRTGESFEIKDDGGAPLLSDLEDAGADAGDPVE